MKNVNLIKVIKNDEVPFIEKKHCSRRDTEQSCPRRDTEQSVTVLIQMVYI